MRTRGVINTTHRTDDFDNINQSIKNKASDVYKATIRGEHKKIRFELDRRLTTNSTCGFCYSEYLIIEQRYTQLSSEIELLGGNKEAMLKEFAQKQFVKKYLGQDKYEKDDLLERKLFPHKDRLHQLMSEYSEISIPRSKMRQFFTNVYVDGITNFFSEMVLLSTTTQRCYFLDCLLPENFKPLEEIVVDINTKHLHGKLNEEEVTDLCRYMLAKYFPNHKTNDPC